MSYFYYQAKKIFYKETEKGTPVILLHGDTASSLMFEPLLPLYEEYFHLILLDFLGNGKSDRVDEFPSDLWIDQSKQVLALIEHLKYPKVNLIGTSGGAWVAVNTALARPDRIQKVVADSFDGRTLADDFADNLVAERNYAKNDSFAKQFYEWCQGPDWEDVVDRNTKALLECANKKLPLFIKPLESLAVPILLTGSLEDTMCRKDMRQEYEAILRTVPQGSMHLFPTGEHPAMVSNAEQFVKLITAFLIDDNVSKR